MLWISLALAGEWAQQPPDPRYETDFTAYTLDPGLVRLGVVNMDVGVLRQLQLGTTPILLPLGVLSLRAKVNAITQGPFDLSFEAGVLYRKFNLEGLAVSLTSYPVMLRASEVVSPRFSLHQGLRVENFEANGSFGLDMLGLATTAIVGEDISSELAAGLADAGGLYGGAHLTMVQARLAADFRLNHRDSLIYQYSGWTWLGARVDAGYEGEGEEVQLGLSGKVRTFLPGQVLGTHTLSWQFSWPHWHLRLGLGFSAAALKNPLGTITQACELYYVIGKVKADAPLEDEQPPR